MNARQIRFLHRLKLATLPFVTEIPADALGHDLLIEVPIFEQLLERHEGAVGHLLHDVQLGATWFHFSKRHQDLFGRNGL